MKTEIVKGMAEFVSNLFKELCNDEYLNWWLNNGFGIGKDWSKAPEGDIFDNFYNYGLQYCAGSYKFVLMGEGLGDYDDYVLKISFDQKYDNCKKEVDLFKTIPFNLQKFFAETFYICDIETEEGSISVYGAPKCTENEDGYNDISFNGYVDEIVQEGIISFADRERISKGIKYDGSKEDEELIDLIDDIYCDYYDLTDDDRARIIFENDYEWEIVSELFDFIDKVGLGDFHNGNIGFGRYGAVIIDYAWY